MDGVDPVVNLKQPSFWKKTFGAPVLDADHQRVEASRQDRRGGFVPRTVVRKTLSTRAEVECQAVIQRLGRCTVIDTGAWDHSS